MKDLSIIIVTYNHYDILKSCISSIFRFNDIGESLEVIVSDNSPDNNVVDSVAADFPSVKIIKNKNIGFGRGCNKGASASEGKYLLFLNPDTLIIEPSFKFATEKFRENANLAAFGYKLLQKDYSNGTSFLLMDDNNFIHKWLFSKYYQKNDIYKNKKHSIIGADLFVRKDIFIKAGMFDENIFMYCEEGDLFKRIFKLSNNYITTYFPDKKIVHLEGGMEDSGPSALLNKLSRMLDSYLYYCTKWNINFINEVNKMQTEAKIKIIRAIITGNNQDKEFYKNLLSIYKSYIKKTKHNKQI